MAVQSHAGETARPAIAQVIANENLQQQNSRSAAATAG
jgi:hypothetical protein